MENSRVQTIRDLLQEWEQLPEAQKRTLSVEFRGVTRQLPVINISPTALLLNHDNYRLAAQLEDSPDREKIRVAPLSQESQDLLTKLLMETDDYKKLKEQLSFLGQKEPGLITADGLLVNGNTRTVAIRDLGLPGVMVGVLPSVTSEDVLNLQVQLQMQRLVHQDYSFTNQLLLIEKLRQISESDEALIARLGWKPGAKSRGQLAQAKRILSIIRWVREISPNVPYRKFDDFEEALKNLDSDYEEQKQVDFDKAEQLKIKRLLGMFAGLTKDQIRAIKGDFLEDDPEYQEITKDFNPKEQGAIKTDLFGGSNPSAERDKAILRKFSQKSYDDRGKPQTITDPDLIAIGNKAKYETELAISKERMKKFVSDPIKYLQQATTNLGSVNADFEQLKQQRDFKKAAFLQELSSLKQVIAQIEAKAKDQ